MGFACCRNYWKPQISSASGLADSSMQVGVGVSRVLASDCEHGRAVPWRRVTVDEHQDACMLTTWRSSACSTW